MHTHIILLYSACNPTTHGLVQCKLVSLSVKEVLRIIFSDEYISTTPIIELYHPAQFFEMTVAHYICEYRKWLACKCISMKGKGVINRKLLWWPRDWGWGPHTCVIHCKAMAHIPLYTCWKRFGKRQMKSDYLSRTGSSWWATSN